MTTYGGVTVYLYGFLTSTLDGGKHSALHSAFYILRENVHGIQWIGNLVEGRWLLKRKKFNWSVLNMEAALLPQRRYTASYARRNDSFVREPINLLAPEFYI